MQHGYECIAVSQGTKNVCIESVQILNIFGEERLQTERVDKLGDLPSQFLLCVSELTTRDKDDGLGLGHCRILSLLGYNAYRAKAQKEQSDGGPETHRNGPDKQRLGAVRRSRSNRSTLHRGLRHTPEFYYRISRAVRGRNA